MNVYTSLRFRRAETSATHIRIGSRGSTDTETFASSRGVAANLEAAALNANGAAGQRLCNRLAFEPPRRDLQRRRMNDASLAASSTASVM